MEDIKSYAVRLAGFDLIPGERGIRQELHLRWGGRLTPSISPSRRTPADEFDEFEIGPLAVMAGFRTIFDLNDVLELCESGTEQAALRISATHLSLSGTNTLIPAKHPLQPNQVASAFHHRPPLTAGRNNDPSDLDFLKNVAQEGARWLNVVFFRAVIGSGRGSWLTALTANPGLDQAQHCDRFVSGPELTLSLTTGEPVLPRLGQWARVIDTQTGLIFTPYFGWPAVEYQDWALAQRIAQTMTRAESDPWRAVPLELSANHRPNDG